MFMGFSWQEYWSHLPSSKYMINEVVFWHPFGNKVREIPNTSISYMSKFFSKNIPENYFKWFWKVTV